MMRHCLTCGRWIILAFLAHLFIEVGIVLWIWRLYV